MTSVVDVHLDSQANDVKTNRIYVLISHVVMESVWMHYSKETVSVNQDGRVSIVISTLMNVSLDLVIMVQHVVMD